jgi:hypothetical protein
MARLDPAISGFMAGSYRFIQMPGNKSGHDESKMEGWYKAAVARPRQRDILPDPGWEPTHTRRPMDQRLLEASPSNAGQIPLVDVAAYIAGEPGALETAAAELRFALEHIGFFYLAGHGVPQELIDRVFVETKRFHALPLEER